MKKLVFGSLNIDRTYSVERFVKPGETISAGRMELFCGGKGFNQAIALARAGSEVYFAGAVGADGEILLEELKRNHVRLDFVKKTRGASGHAVIQVDREGQNCIMILAGANGEISREDVDRVLRNFEKGDLILLQNEISNMDYILRQAQKKEMLIALNPSPCDSRVKDYDLNSVNYLLVNETEGAAIAGCSGEDEVLEMLHACYPETNIVLTRGAQGSSYIGENGEKVNCGIYAMPVVDTTAAGDTFTGYFLSEVLRHGQVREALETASIASGIAVSRPGASSSIPSYQEVVQTERSCAGKNHG